METLFTVELSWNDPIVLSDRPSFQKEITFYLSKLFDVEYLEFI